MPRLRFAVLAATMALPAPADEGHASCDAQAMLAGEIMALRQVEAPRNQVERMQLFASADPALLTELISHAYAGERATDPDAQEMVSFHFAAAVYEACTAGEVPTSIAPTDAEAPISNERIGEPMRLNNK